MWHKIDLRIPKNFKALHYDFEAMYRYAVDLSRGGLLEINFVDIGSYSLLTYIANRSSNLRRLRVSDFLGITRIGIFEEVEKFPLLEEVEFSFWCIREVLIKGIGQPCPNLKTLKLNGKFYMKSADKVALTIAETMPGLCHLQLFGSGLLYTGLKAIFDNCPNLEHLDLRHCFDFDLVEDLENQFSEGIKVVRRANFF